MTGAVGAGVAVGSGKLITWNMATDWNGNVATLSYTVTADDGVIPAPDGFALIPAGSFLMGDQSSPLVGNPGELPVRSVQVSGFLLAKYEVTKGLWDEVRAWGAANGYTDLPAGGGKAANHPVHSINWYAMVKWCNARSQKDGLTPCYHTSVTQGSADIFMSGTPTQLDSMMVNWGANGYRLPTEAEWEKSARGGLVGQNFPWGNTINHTYDNYLNSNYSYESPQNQGYHPTYATGGEPYTSPVGCFSANGYGLYDMAGNVWEWCWDCFGSYPAGSQTDPRGASSGSSRVVRGGCWYDGAYRCRVADRVGYGPGRNTNFVGFRTARSLVP